MVSLSGRYKVASVWLGKTWLQWLIAVAFFFMTAFYYMGPALTQCSSSSMALFSDSSGGLGWSQWASGNKLSWDYTYKTNYPIGESLQRPSEVSSVTMLVPYRFLSWLTTPTCGLNLLILLSYMSVGLVMFGLVRWLFKRTSIALFAGYAAAFVPYHQLKSESHVTYMNNAMFIGIIWAYLWLLNKPSYKKAGVIALISALAMYFDGYFILLTGALVSILVAFTLLSKDDVKNGTSFVAAWGRQIKKNFKHYLKYVVFLGAATLVLVMPLLIYQLHHGTELGQSLAAGRGQIQLEAKVYSARPAEFLLPSYNNFLVPQSYEHWRLVHQHGSNPSEDTLYIGLTVFLLAAVASLALFNPNVRKLKIKENISYQYLAALSLVAIVLCGALSLPPTVTLFHHVIKTPTHYLIDLTAYWRVFARFFQVIDPLTIVLASAGLFVITRKWSSLKTTLLVVICFALLFFEYLPQPLRAINNLYKSSPRIYQTLSADKSVKVVAEYPLTDLAYAALVFTFQQVHQKALINPNYSPIVKSPFTQSLAGLNDPQTIGMLKSSGVDVIIVSGVNMDGNKQLVQYRPADDSGVSLGANILYSYKISPDVVPSTSVLAPATGFDGATVDKNQISHHVIHSRAVLEILLANHTRAPSKDYAASFEAISLTGKQNNLTVRQNNQILWQGVISPTEPAKITVTARGDQDIQLVPAGPMDVLDLNAVR